MVSLRTAFCAAMLLGSTLSMPAMAMDMRCRSDGRQALCQPSDGYRTQGYGARAQSSLPLKSFKSTTLPDARRAETGSGSVRLYGRTDSSGGRSYVGRVDTNGLVKNEKGQTVGRVDKNRWRALNGQQRPLD